MSVEQIPERLDGIDNHLGEIGDMSLEISGIKEKCPYLNAKETFVATSLIENACMMNADAKNMILTFNKNILLQSKIS